MSGPTITLGSGSDDIEVTRFEYRLKAFVATSKGLYDPQTFTRSGAPEMLSTPVGELKDFLASVLRSDNLRGDLTAHEMSLRASMFLFRKLLPTPPGVDPVTPYRTKLSKTADVDWNFYNTMANTVHRIFPYGWDKNYASVVEGYTPNKSSCLELSAKEGGSRAFLSSLPGYDFVSACKGSGFVEIPEVRKVVTLDDGGKTRIVTIASAYQNQLGPLHKLLYNHLSKTEWLLRGDANAKSMEGMKRVHKDEVFVSGDYEAATDNFNATHSQLLLRLIQEQSRFVPAIVWDEAVRSLKGDILYEGEDGIQNISPQNNGQMMGNFLSFPLLCLTNFLGVVHALGWARTEEITLRGGLKINGDDIVLRCSTSEMNRWMASVKDAGLVLSKGKTMVHKRFFSLNSTFFVATREKVKLVPVIRAKSVWGQDPNRTIRDVRALLRAGTVGFQGERKWRLQWEVLRSNSRCILGDSKFVPFSSLTRRGLNPEVLWRAPRTRLRDRFVQREYTVLKSCEKGLDREEIPVKPSLGGEWRYVKVSMLRKEYRAMLTEDARKAYYGIGWGKEAVGWGRRRRVEKSRLDVTCECIPDAWRLPREDTVYKVIIPKCHSCSQQDAIRKAKLIKGRYEGSSLPKTVRLPRWDLPPIFRNNPHWVPLPDWDGVKCHKLLSKEYRPSRTYDKRRDKKVPVLKYWFPTCLEERPAIRFRAGSQKKI